MSDKDNATVARLGAAYSCETPTTVPSAATTPTPGATGMAAAGFAAWGTLAKDGLKLKIDGEESSIEDWDGNDVHKWTSKHNVQITIKPLEILTKAVAEEVFGASNVTADSSGNVTAIKVNGKSVGERNYVIDFRCLDNRLGRLYIPCGSVATAKELAINSTDPMASELTIDCLSDEDGNKAYLWFATPTQPSPDPEEG